MSSGCRRTAVGLAVLPAVGSLGCEARRLIDTEATEGKVAREVKRSSGRAPAQVSRGRRAREGQQVDCEIVYPDGANRKVDVSNPMTRVASRSG